VGCKWHQPSSNPANHGREWFRNPPDVSQTEGRSKPMGSPTRTDVNLVSYHHLTRRRNISIISKMGVPSSYYLAIQSSQVLKTVQRDLWCGTSIIRCPEAMYKLHQTTSCNSASNCQLGALASSFFFEYGLIWAGGHAKNWAEQTFLDVQPTFPRCLGSYLHSFYLVIHVHISH
jgi:hypothetical protein